MSDKIWTDACAEARTDTIQRALALIHAVRAALASGVIHRNAAGQLLTTDREVLQCLTKEGSVSLEQADRQWRMSGDSFVGTNDRVSIMRRRRA